MQVAEPLSYSRRLSLPASLGLGREEVHPSNNFALINLAVFDFAPGSLPYTKNLKRASECSLLKTLNIHHLGLGLV